jgi:serine/threonine-protein kinase RsbW
VAVRHIQYTQTAAARTEELQAIRSSVEKEALQFGFSEETAFRIALAVDEACSNIIKHAFNGVEGGSFGIEISTTDDTFCITLLDEGIEYNPETPEDLDVADQARARCRGGLGLYLIAEIMDDMEYERRDDSCNCLRLVKRLTSASD